MQKSLFDSAFNAQSLISYLDYLYLISTIKIVMCFIVEVKK